MGSREEVHAAAQVHSLVKSLFQAIDADNDGRISAREVHDFFRTRATGVSPELLNLILSKLESRRSSGFRSNQLERELCLVAGLQQLETARERHGDGTGPDSSASRSSRLPRVQALAPSIAMMVDAPQALKQASAIRAPDGGSLPASNFYLSVDRLQPALDLVARAASELAPLVRATAAAEVALGQEGMGWLRHVSASPWHSQLGAASYLPQEMVRAAVTVFFEIARGRAALPLVRFAANLDLALATCLDTLVIAKEEAESARVAARRDRSGGRNRSESEASAGERASEAEEGSAAGAGAASGTGTIGAGKESERRGIRAGAVAAGPSTHVRWDAGDTAGEQSEVRALRQVGRLREGVAAAPVHKIRKSLRQCIVPIGAIASDLLARGGQSDGGQASARAGRRHLRRLPGDSAGGGEQGGQHGGRFATVTVGTDRAASGAGSDGRAGTGTGSALSRGISFVGEAASEDTSSSASTRGRQAAGGDRGVQRGGSMPADLASPAGQRGRGMTHAFRSLGEAVDVLAGGAAESGKGKGGRRSGAAADRHGPSGSSGRTSVVTAASGEAYRSHMADLGVDAEPAEVGVGGLLSVYEWVDAWKGVAQRHGHARASALLAQLVQALRCDPAAWVDRPRAGEFLGVTTQRDATAEVRGLALVAWTAACGYRACQAPVGVQEPLGTAASAAALVPPSVRFGGWGMPVLLSTPIRHVLDTAAPEPLAVATEEGAARYGAPSPPPSLCFSWPRPSLVEGESDATAAGDRRAGRWSLPTASLVTVELDAAGAPRRIRPDPRVPHMVVAGELTPMVSAQPLLAPTALPPRPEAALRVVIPLQALPLPAFRALMAQDVAAAGSPLAPLWLAMALLAAEGGGAGGDDDVEIPLQGGVRGGLASEDRGTDPLVAPGPSVGAEELAAAARETGAGPLCAFGALYPAAGSDTRRDAWSARRERVLWSRSAPSGRHSGVAAGTQEGTAVQGFRASRGGGGKGGGRARPPALAGLLADESSDFSPRLYAEGLARSNGHAGGATLRGGAAGGLSAVDAHDAASHRSQSSHSRSGRGTATTPGYDVPGPLHTAWTEAMPGLGTARLLGWPGTVALYSAWMHVLAARAQELSGAASTSAPPAEGPPPSPGVARGQPLLSLSDEAGCDGVVLAGTLGAIRLTGSRSARAGAWTLQTYYNAAGADVTQALWCAACGPVWSEAWSAEAGLRTDLAVHAVPRYPLSMAADAAAGARPGVPPSALRRHPGALALRLTPTAWLLAAAPGSRAGARGVVALRSTTHREKEGSIAHQSSGYHPEQLLASLLMRKLQQYTSLGARRARALVWSGVALRPDVFRTGPAEGSPSAAALEGARLLQFRLALGEQFTPAALLLAATWELAGAGFEADTVRAAPLSAAELVDVLRTDARSKKLAPGPEEDDDAAAMGAFSGDGGAIDEVMDAAADSDRRGYFAEMPQICASGSRAQQLDLADVCRAKEEQLRGRMAAAASWPARVDAEPIEAAYGRAGVPLQDGTQARLAVALPAAATPTLPLDLSATSPHAGHHADLKRIELTHLKVTPHQDATKPNSAALLPPARLFALLAALAPVSELFFAWYRAACAVYQACAAACHRDAREGRGPGAATGSVTVQAVAERIAIVLAAVEGRDRKMRVSDVSTELLGGVPATKQLLQAVEVMLAPVKPRDAAEMLARIPDHSQGLGSMLLHEGQFAGAGKEDLRAAAQHESQCAALGRALWLSGVDTEEAVQVLRARITRAS